MSIPKDKPGRSKAYLEFIRTQPCCICSIKTSEPHHTVKAGFALKGSDFSCIPMCFKHHNELGVIGVETFQRKHLINLYRVVAKYTIAWLDIHCADKE